MKIPGSERAVEALDHIRHPDRLALHPMLLNEALNPSKMDSNEKLSSPPASKAWSQRGRIDRQAAPLRIAGTSKVVAVHRFNRGSQSSCQHDCIHLVFDVIEPVACGCHGNTEQVTTARRRLRGWHPPTVRATACRWSGRSPPLAHLVRWSPAGCRSARPPSPVADASSRRR
jgi:hypothetical protein